MMFDAMGALSSNFNDSPEMGSRPFDENRDGFVIAAGGGMVVVEELNHALERNSKIYGEIIGYSATSDGVDMVSPSGEGAINCMRNALKMSNLETVDYLNAHGTSTPAGDPTELLAIKEVFKNPPIVGSTKSQTGHALGAAGVLECIYSLLMLNGSYIAESININSAIAESEGINLSKSYKEKNDFDTFMSNSFGFGGTNASLVMKKYS